MIDCANRGQKLKVTLIGTLPPLKGLSPYCLSLATELEKEVDLEFLGFRRLYPDFLYPGGTRTGQADPPRPALTRARTRQMLTYYNPLSWIWAGITLRGQVVHAQWWSYVLAGPYAILLTLAKLRRRKCVLTVHNVVPHEQGRLSRALNRVILRFGDHFIVHNKRNGELLSSGFGVPRHKISVIPHGILTPAPLKGLTKSEARDKLGIPQDARVAMSFGNIRDYKGVDDFIDAMTQVAADDPKAHLVIAGQPWQDGEVYRDAVEKAGLSERSLLWLRFVDPEQVEVLFAAADVLALPYKYFDSQSGVAAIALHFGLPMVVTEVGGLPDVAGDKRVVVPPGDITALARALSLVLQDDVFRSLLAAKTVEKAANYQWDDIASATVEVYRLVLSRNDSAATDTTNNRM